ncbi:MAG TPA: SUMF1/EgtB/PvdO family nonheme iron enzyme [Labilithrix sp.]|jgi:hypothetical protein
MRRSKLRAVLIAQAAAFLAVAASLSFAWWLRAHGLELGDLRYEMRRPQEARFSWTSVDKLHWQVVSSSPIEDLALVDAREGDSAGCGAGMVRVKGGLRQGDVEWLQDAACTDWISRDFPARCRTFDAEKLAASIAPLPQQPLDFCMDRYEYPNALGQNPIIVVTFHEAEAMCGKAKKRLCTESEWTLACEGEEARPYPYGYTRDPSACVVDRNWRPFAEGALQPRDGQQAREELDRLWQAEPSGSRGACKSPFGVYDMTGNVDEWTSSVRKTGFRSVLKGGYWGPVRARCRPSTRAHNEDFVAYQQGFRCCADSNASVPAPVPAIAVARFADASAPPADTHASVDDPTPPKSAPFEDQDEIAAIKRARVGFGCATASGHSDGTLAAIGIALAAVSTRRRAALRDRASSARRPRRR